MSLKNLVNKVSNSTILKKIIQFVKSNFVISLIVIVLIWLIALIPSYLYFVFRWLLDPVGFWQELTLFVAWAFFLGSVQLLTGFIAFLMTMGIITDEI